MSRTQAEIRDTCEKACAILKKTKDGDLLEPQDLKLTEYAVNGFLNEERREIFEKLYQRVVIDENYIRPYLHGIENMSRDHEGYIYYKNMYVEHYDRDYMYSEAAKNELTELKRRCEFLERKGIEVSNSNVIWGWDKYADEHSGEWQKKLDRLIGANALYYSRVEIYNSGREYNYLICGSAGDLEQIKNHPVTQSMVGRYFDNEYQIKIEPFIYESGDKPRKNMILPSDLTRIKIENILPSCHDYLKEQDKLEILPVVTHKTDFAENYEKTKELDSLLNSPGKSLQYSVVDLWSVLNHTQRFFMYGTPTLDEIKKHEVY